MIKSEIIRIYLYPLTRMNIWSGALLGYRDNQMRIYGTQSVLQKNEKLFVHCSNFSELLFCSFNWNLIVSI